MEQERGGWNWALWGSLTILTLVYFPAFTNDYAKLDTFGFLNEVTLGSFDTWKSWISIQGRPLTSALTELFFATAGGISGLQGVRFIGFIGLLVFAFTLERLFRKHNYSPCARLFLTLAICSVPGLATLVLWTVCFPYTWAAALAVLSAQLCCDEPDRLFSKRKLAGWIGLFIALWVYQPSTLFGLIPLLLKLLEEEASPRSFLRQNTLNLSYFYSVLGIYYITYKLLFLPLMPPQEGVSLARISLAQDLLNQFATLFGRAIPETLHGWAYFYGLTAKTVVAITTLAALLTGGVFSLWRGPRVISSLRGLGIGALMFIFIPCLYLYDGSPYRLMGPFSAIIIVLVFSSLRSIASPRRERFTLTAFAFIAALQVIACGDVLHRFWVSPASNEVLTYRAQIEASLNDGPPDALIVIPSVESTYGGKRKKYLFGLLTSSADYQWTIDPFLRLLMSEQFGKDYARSVPIFLTKEIFDTHHALVLDANELFFGKEHPDTVDPDTLIELKKGAATWWLSPWLGIYQLLEINEETGAGRIEHLDLGSVNFQWEGDDLLLKPMGSEWLRTNADLFPKATSLDGETVELLPRTKSDPI
tara:strand:+ start:100164 stop:101930 length:1767 start_codon:yes stop_codon:yes gene_type:complete